MEDDVNSVKKNDYPNCRKKEKPGIRKLFSNGKKILFKIYNKNEKQQRNVSLSNVQFFIIVAWRRIKILSSGGDLRESDTDENHLHSTYVVAYILQFLINFLLIFLKHTYTI